MTKVTLIGLSGASSSGKTTVSKILTSLIPNSQLVHQDDFYLPDEQIPFDKELNDQNWDCPDAFDMTKFKETLLKLKANEPLEVTTKETQSSDDIIQSKLNPEETEEFKELINSHKKKLLTDHRFIFIDGLLMYHDVELLDSLDLKLFFKTSYETLRKRRCVREYSIDTGVWVDPPSYFEDFVWPNYYMFNKSIFEDDEEQIKLNGGTLNEYAKQRGIAAFQNDDSVNLKILVSGVLNYIIDNL